MDEGLTIEQLDATDWNKIQLNGDDCVLLYKDTFKPEDNCDGFEFKCLNFCTQRINQHGIYDGIYYNVVFEGKVAFDGVRHLFFGSEKTDNYGYLYCCDLPLLIMALNELDKLQVAKCKYVAEERNEEKINGKIQDDR
jgi:hypothetical protein